MKNAKRPALVLGANCWMRLPELPASQRPTAPAPSEPETVRPAEGFYAAIAHLPLSSVMQIAVAKAA